MKSVMYYGENALSKHIQEIQTLNKTYIDHANKPREDARVYKYDELLQTYTQELTTLLSKTRLSEQQIMEAIIHPFNTNKVALDQTTSLALRATSFDKRYTYLQELTKIFMKNILK